MITTRIGRTALYYYSVIVVGMGWILFFKWEEMVVEGGLEKYFYQT